MLSLMQMYVPQIAESFTKTIQFILSTIKKLFNSKNWFAALAFLIDAATIFE